jgi:hypothetical protein
MDGIIPQTDHDFIKSLKAKQTKMREEIATKKQEIASIEKKIISVKRAIEAFEGIKYGEEPKVKIAIPADYSKNLTWSEKVLWAAHGIGGGFVDNIADKIAKVEPDLKKETLKRIVTQYASQLKKSGNLRHEKVGIKFKYLI